MSYAFKSKILTNLKLFRVLLICLSFFFLLRFYICGVFEYSKDMPVLVYLFPVGIPVSLIIAVVLQVFTTKGFDEIALKKTGMFIKYSVAFKTDVYSFNPKDISAIDVVYIDRPFFYGVTYKSKRSDIEVKVKFLLKNGRQVCFVDNFNNFGLLSAFDNFLSSVEKISITIPPHCRNKKELTSVLKSIQPETKKIISFNKTG